MTAIIVLLALVVAAPIDAAKRPPPTACTAGRFLLTGAPLIRGQGAPVTDAVEVGATRIAIGAACAAVAPKRFKPTRRGTKVKARWDSCAGLTGKVTFTGAIVDGCDTLRGTLQAKRFKGKVQGTRSRCGDGIVDDGGGERCDPPAVGGCDDACGRPVTVTIGPLGGRIVSTDGRVTLDVPPGALAADTVISIRPADPDELPALLAGVGAAYDLGPDGLQFQLPVTASWRYDDALAATLGGLVIASSDGSPPEPLADQRLSIDETGAVATGTLTHFTIIASGFGLRANVNAVAIPGTTIGVNQPFEIEVSARLLGDAGVVQDPPLAIVHTDQTPPGVIIYAGTTSDVTIGALRQNQTTVRGRVPYRCGPTPGAGPYVGRIRIDEFEPLDAQIVIRCVASTTSTTRVTTTTTTTTTTSTSTTTTSSTSTTTVTSTTTSTTTTTSLMVTTTSSSTTTTTTSTLPTINCCDCPQPRGCASGPTVQPGDCVEFGCVFVTNAVCTDTGDCASLSTTTSSTTTSSTSTTIKQPQISLIDPESIGRVDDDLFDDDEGGDENDGARVREGNLVTVAAGNGWAIVDYVTGEIVVGDYLAPFSSPAFARFAASALGGSSGPGAGFDVQAVVQAGPGGPAITHYDLDFGDFGFTQISPGSPACFDAAPYGGDHLSGGIVLPCGRQLTTREPQMGFFNGGKAYSQFPATEGFVLSGFRRQADGPIVAITDGTPGKIWKHPATGALTETPQELGASGNSPRRVRCAGGVCAVSNFGSDTLTILIWSAQDVVAIVGTVPVGDGPVGIDLRTRLDGNVEVLSTGFNDDSWSLTVLAPNGGTVSNQEFPAPTGCDAPGHVIWGRGNEVILSCNGSDRLALAAAP